jgi:uncharacterized RDD family membrane protein YckC
MMLSSPRDPLAHQEDLVAGGSPTVARRATSPEPPRHGARAGALFIDLFLVWTGWYLACLIFSPSPAAYVALTRSAILVFALYRIGTLIATGATVGQRLLGIFVERSTGGRLSPVQIVLSHGVELTIGVVQAVLWQEWYLHLGDRGINPYDMQQVWGAFPHGAGESLSDWLTAVFLFWLFLNGYVAVLNPDRRTIAERFAGSRARELR